MRTRKFGKTGMEVSEIGLGGFAIGGYDYGPTDDEESLAAIERAYSLGVNFFDTADMYGTGRSESLMGRALKGKNPPAIIATKVGFVGERGNHGKKDFSRAHILSACDASLKRLKREAIDLYQLHNPTLADLVSGEAFAAMDELAAQGKVRHWGVSVGSRKVAATVRHALQWPTMSSIQIVYNLFNSGDMEELREDFRRTGVGVIVRAPLEYGMLTGKFAPEERFAPGDHRGHRWKPEEFSALMEKTRRLKEVFQGRAFTLPQLAICSSLAATEAAVVICGAKRPSQVEENVAASLLLGDPITPEDVRRAEEIAKS